MGHLILRVARKIYQKFGNGGQPIPYGLRHSVKEYANELIASMIGSGKPFMASRIGANEIWCLTNYLGVKRNERSCIGFIKGRTLPWWWEKKMLNQMHFNAGFFPSSPTMAERFGDMMIKDIGEIDVLGSWLPQEQLFYEQLKKAKRVMLEDIEPFFARNPWTKALEGKKVLVVHPFSESIEKQYKIKNQIFPDGLLPDFELETIKAVQTAAGERSAFADWFEALDYMKNQIDSKDYDVCIIGCGAYGLPLAAHVKRMGKQSIHLAGATQLLFGIIGARWETFRNSWPHHNLFNEYWVRPLDIEKPANSYIIENSTYW